MNWRKEFDKLVFINDYPHRNGVGISLKEYSEIWSAAWKDGYCLPVLPVGAAAIEEAERAAEIGE